MTLLIKTDYFTWAMKGVIKYVIITPEKAGKPSIKM